MSHRPSRRQLIAGLVVVAIGVAVYASGVLSDLPDPETLIEDLAEALGRWTYALVAGLAFLETGAFVGLIAPGEFTVILGGVIAGQGEINVMVLLALTWFSAFLGDTTSFVIGARLGRGFLERNGPRVKITPERLTLVEGYFARHGGKTILIGRFIGLVRALAPFIAGSSKMPYRRFAPYSIIGTGLWATTFVLLGYFFWRSFEEVAGIAGRATVGFGIVVGAIVAVVYCYRRLRKEDERRRLAAWFDRQGRRPLLRPVAAVIRPLWRRVLMPAARALGPPVRFVGDRITPGGLGIELTTTLAIASVGGFVFIAYADELLARPGLTPADSEVVDLARDLETDWLVDIARVVTDLGSLPVVLTLLAVAVGLLIWHRRRLELSVLVIGVAAIYAGVHLAKAGIDRPRPPQPLDNTSGSAFPSGHAAYGVVYVAMAVIGARVLPGLASRAALVVVAIVVAAVIGATRVYLRAHYWSDVVGGWALGGAVFGLVAMLALLISYIRHNGRADGPDQPGHH
ncbi:MAG TPA: bifunctional DedA family/phosphatase PAP2 family protein [Thermoleophilaceae bacterium]|nr:bifunctional DedA family/phosphatase PAP2 family protein [Thermoleophilaceae bacterium]